MIICVTMMCYWDDTQPVFHFLHYKFLLKAGKHRFRNFCILFYDGSMGISRKLHFDRIKQRKTLNVCATSTETEILRKKM